MLVDVDVRGHQHRGSCHLAFLEVQFEGCAVPLGPLHVQGCDTGHAAANCAQDFPPLHQPIPVHIEHLVQMTNLVVAVAWSQR